MKKLKNKSKITTTIALVLILTFSALMTTMLIPTPVEAADDYGDLLQYEWVASKNGPSKTSFAEGPSPDSPDILWKLKFPGISQLAAFNGKLFVRAGSETWAVDPFTGGTIWKVPFTGGVIKLDDTRMLLGGVCIETETGNELWTVPPGYRGTYIPELKLAYASNGVWNLSDLSQPPTLAWTVTETNTEFYDKEYIALYGDGMLFSKGDNAILRGLDVKTGETLWLKNTYAPVVYGIQYYMGRVIHGGLDNNVHCWNGTTGELLWTYNVGTDFGFFGTSGACGYGKFYQQNQDQHVYAIDVVTGKLVWKYKGLGVYYAEGCLVGGGKVFACTGDNIWRDPETGEPGRSQYVALDAETGKLIWEIPIKPGWTVAPKFVAYGNLYETPVRSWYGETTWEIYSERDELWCIGGRPKGWSMFRGDPAHTAEGGGPKDLTFRWKYQTNGAVTSSPSIVDGVAYVGSHDFNLYALDADTGSKIWSFATGYQIKSSPAVVDGKVYTGADDGNFYCLDAEDGTQLWKTPGGGITRHSPGSTFMIRSSPTVVGGRVYVGSLDKNVYCLDATSGNVIWKFLTPGAITSTAAVVDGAVYITSSTPLPDGTLYKLDANDGSVIWQLAIPYQRNSLAMHASPTVADGMVFVPAESWDHYGINATTGDIVWKWRGYSKQYNVASLTYAYGRVYTQDFFDATCLNATTGEKIWSTWLARDVYGSPAYAVGKVYYTNEQMAIYVLDAVTGEKISFYDLPSQVHSSCSLYSGRVYVGCFDWNVYCFEEFIPEVPLISTEVVASMSKSQVDKDLSESVTVSGNLSPIYASMPVKVTFTKPDGTNVDVTTTTTAEGDFEVSYTPDVVGDWTATAWWDGDEDRTFAFTEDMSLKVVGEEPTNGNGNGNGTEPPPEEEGIPAEYIYAAVAVIAIVIIAVAAYVYLKRGK